jgi:hypothetical protein
MGGLSVDVGPSASWTAFEYSSCAGRRLPLVLLRTSLNTSGSGLAWVIGWLRPASLGQRTVVIVTAFGQRTRASLYPHRLGA